MKIKDFIETHKKDEAWIHIYAKDHLDSQGNPVHLYDGMAWKCPSEIRELEVGNFDALLGVSCTQEKIEEIDRLKKGFVSAIKQMESNHE